GVGDVHRLLGVDDHHLVAHRLRRHRGGDGQPEDRARGVAEGGRRLPDRERERRQRAEREGGREATDPPAPCVPAHIPPPSKTR
ncbi:MAG: hypothetical protein ACK559_36330, partial [bacterium]